jgi:hypothetical protein
MLETPTIVDLGLRNVSYAINCFIKLLTLGINQTIFSTYIGGGFSHEAIIFEVNSSNQLVLGSGNGNVNSTTTLTTGIWYEVEANFDNSTGTVRLFIDGVFSGTGTLASPNEGVYAKVGNIGPLTRFFSGFIDDLVVIKNANFHTTNTNYTPRTDSYIPLSAGNLPIEWNSRNRFQQTVNLLDYYSGNITSEPGVTYSGEVRRADTNAVITSFSGETALNRLLSVPYSGQVILSIWSVNANGNSFYPVTHTFTIT